MNTLLILTKFCFSGFFLYELVPFLSCLRNLYPLKVMKMFFYRFVYFSHLDLCPIWNNFVYELGIGVISCHGY